VSGPVVEIESAAELTAHLRDRGGLRDAVVQGVDLGDVDVDWAATDVHGACFVGCRIPDPAVAMELQRNGGTVIPELEEGLPFRLYPPRLYSYEELVGAGIDAAVASYFERSRSRTGSPDPDRPIEAIAQRLHDTAMTDAIWELVLPADGPRRRMVGVMGGHACRRDDSAYWSVVELAHDLTAAGFTIATGGGPGIMEAGNLGAYLTRAGDRGAVGRAREQLERAPTIFDPDYGDRAEAVYREHADRPGGVSLAIPTWMYGEEPVGRFASHIAKYFANSIREDGLLRVADSGIVFAAGGAGTVQEIFQDLAINTYADPDDRAPMVFLGREQFGAGGIHDLVVRMAASADPPFEHLIAITDDPAEAVDRIVSA
jgi:predicted Rossmann-fold nucleotide-binding protein